MFYGDRVYVWEDEKVLQTVVLMVARQPEHTVSPRICGFHIHGVNQRRSKEFREKKVSESSKKQSLRLPHIECWAEPVHLKGRAHARRHLCRHRSCATSVHPWVSVSTGVLEPILWGYERPLNSTELTVYFLTFFKGEMVSFM